MNVFLIVLGVALSALFVLPMFENVFNFGTAAGLTLGIIPVCLGIFGKSESDEAFKTAVFLYLFVLIILTAVCVSIFVTGRGKSGKASAVIVLGCRVKGDKPSLALRKRIEKAYEFLINNKKAVAVLSGGKGDDEDISEAQCMFSQLCDMGISPKRLICEDKSVNTDENIRFSEKILAEKGIGGRVAVVTSEYHQIRAGLICKRYRLNAFPVSSKTKASHLPTFLLREAFALPGELLRLIRGKNNQISENR